MNKKILFALAITIVAIAAVGTVSAFDLGSLFGAPADQQVTIDGENFTIPGTFKENVNASKNGTVSDYFVFNSTEYAKQFTNGTNFINITVYDFSSDFGGNLTDFKNGTVKEISGVKGYLYHDDAGYSYTFDKGNKEIVIQSNDEKLIPPVIA